MLGLLKQACPSWSDSSNWLSQNIGEAEKVETIQCGKQISIQNFKALSMILLTVKPAI